MTILSEKEQTLLGRLIDNFLKLSLEDQQYILGRTEEKAEQAMINNSNNKKNRLECKALGEKNYNVSIKSSRISLIDKYFFEE